MSTAIHKSGLDSSAPLYRQVEIHLRERIQSGSLQPGDMLPPVRELCEQFGGINHLTVRQAIRNLTEEQLVRPVQGKGTFVTQKQKSRRSIALVLPNLEDYMFLGIARGAQNVLDGEDVRTLILDSRGSWNKEVKNVHQLRELPLDGAIIFPLTYHDIAEQIFKMKLADFPFVLVDRYFEDIETASITADNYQGGYDLTKALIEKGRTNFVWIGELTSSSARQRMRGFRDALNDNGIVCPRECLRPMDLAPAASHATYLAALKESLRAHLDFALAHFPRPTLVFGNDQSALLALAALQSRGLRVPEDAAVCGFDDRPEAAQSTPALTTVRQPMERMGQDAARALLKRMSTPEAPIERARLPVEVVLRASA
jgi:DNA-binding LacI/PurR family transcriptional regulator